MVSYSSVVKKYKKNVVVDDFSLSIKAPIFGFLGANGAGKTTIMKMTVGLLEPTSGTIMIDGKPSSDPTSKRKMGFMPETPNFYERFTGMEFMKFCGELFGRRGKTFDVFAENLLKKVDIYDARNRQVRTYSKGMRQRLGFAQALVNDPEYLFLDEPLDGLDPIGRREMKAVMLDLKKEGKKIFLNTHILYDVEEICDELGVIHRGRLLYAGSVSEFCAGKSLEERFVATIDEYEKKHGVQNSHA
jgi:ABC-2 type transport system ATP-binding protein